MAFIWPIVIVIGVNILESSKRTTEAINVFNQFDLLNITDKAIDACVKRASELEKL